MGQQNSTTRQNGECVCGCGAWDRRGRQFADATPADASGNVVPSAPIPATSSVQRYVNVVAERAAGAEGGEAGAGGGDCACRRRRWLQLRRARPPCVCTAYRKVPEWQADDPNDTPIVVGSEPGTVSQYASQFSLVQRCTTCRDDRLAAVLALGARELRKELDALAGLSAGNEAENQDGVDGGHAVLPHPGDLYLLSVAPHSHTDLAVSDPEDCEERARARRALEIAQGVEPPPGYRPHFQVVCNGELRALLLRAPAAPHAHTRVHTQVDYIHCLVPDLKAITACCFYWGKMDRYEAERLLDNKPEGTFLLRDSAQEEHLFSVSFRKYGRSLHARIEHFNHKFSFDSHDPAVFSAPTVTGLIEHYKDPACVMFFEPMLTAPLPRSRPFALQQLARAAIVSATTYDGVDELPLPPRLRAYLKEYHYRQRVRVRRLDDSLACLDHRV